MPTNGTASLRRMLALAVSIGWPKKLGKIGGKGAARSDESPSLAAVLGLLSATADRCAGSCRQVLSVASYGSTSSISSAEEGRQLLVCPRRSSLSSSRRRRWKRFWSGS